MELHALPIRAAKLLGLDKADLSETAGALGAIVAGFQLEGRAPNTWPVRHAHFCSLPGRKCWTQKQTDDFKDCNDRNSRASLSS